MTPKRNKTLWLPEQLGLWNMLLAKEELLKPNCVSCQPHIVVPTWLELLLCGWLYRPIFIIKKNNFGTSASRVFTQISRKKWCSTCAVQHNALITVRIVCSVGECHLTTLNASDIFFEDLIVPFNLLNRFSHLVSNILPSIWGFSIIFSQGSFKQFVLPWGPRWCHLKCMKVKFQLKRSLKQWYY